MQKCSLFFLLCRGVEKMIKDFRKTKNIKNQKLSVFFTFCNYHTVISNSEKLTHPNVTIWKCKYTDFQVDSRTVSHSSLRRYWMSGPRCSFLGRLWLQFHWLTRRSQTQYIMPQWILSLVSLTHWQGSVEMAHPTGAWILPY